MSDYIGNRFIEMTKYHYLKEKSDQSLGKPQPPLEKPYQQSKPLIDLEKPTSINSALSFQEVAEKRKSLRNYQEGKLTLEELSYLLWYTQGVKEKLPGRTLRTVPSAGARHALETYLLINHVEGLKAGLYRYIALEHKLLPVNLEEGIDQLLTKACYGQNFIQKGQVTFIWSAVTYRMKWRYDERAYRYLFLDAGHVCQNLYLASESIACGACAVAAFDDDEINNLLGLDGNQEFVIYLGVVGKR